MSSGSQKNKPLLLIALTIIFVILFAHFFNEVTIFGYTIKPINLFMDIKPDSLQSVNKNSINRSSDFVNKNYKIKKAANLKSNTFSAGISFRPFNKIITETKNLFNTNNLAENYKRQNLNIKDEPLTGNLDQMKYFFDALKNSKTEKIRVAHYGDSGIEGDYITSNIRNDLQDKFGGSGVGFLSITSQDISFRLTTKQSFSNNWKTISVLTANPQNIPLGINGFVFIPEGISWVKYTTTERVQNLKYFSTATLYYSNAKNSAIKYSFNNGKDQTANLTSGNTLNQLILKAPDEKTHSFKLTTSEKDQAYFYGVSLESGNGVYVDNFPWRGNTGLGFTKIPESSFRQFSKLINYKLIILLFGANEASFSSQDNTWYANQMVKVINNLKKIFPKTSILLIGVGDKSVKRGSRFVTDPNIPLILKVQKNIVKRTGIAFWNLFEAMGGYNSMEEWVNANPPLALMDYTHPSVQGANKIGDLIGKALIKAYKDFK
jgi:lysophospholipase L1-like esterase